MGTNSHLESLKTSTSKHYIDDSIVSGWILEEIARSMQLCIFSQFFRFSYLHQSVWDPAMIWTVAHYYIISALGSTTVITIYSSIPQSANFAIFFAIFVMSPNLHPLAWIHSSPGFIYARPMGGPSNRLFFRPPWPNPYAWSTCLGLIVLPEHAVAVLGRLDQAWGATVHTCRGYCHVYPLQLEAITQRSRQACPTSLWGGRV